MKIRSQSLLNQNRVVEGGQLVPTQQLVRTPTEEEPSPTAEKAHSPVES